MSNLLTSSRQRDARACKRLHHYKYQLGYRPVFEGEAPKFGSLIHGGLDVWHSSWQLAPDDRLALTLAAVSVEADPFERVKAEEMLRGYHWRYLEEPYDVLSVETEFEGPVINPSTGQPSRTWRLGGKLDVLVRDRRDGLVRLMEHKTSSEDIRAGSNYWKRLRLDGQISTYYEGARFLGHKVAGCIYDVLGKPRIRPQKATPLDARKHKRDGTLYAAQRDQDESPEEFRARLIEDIAADPAGYFQRGEVVRLEEELAEALHDTWQLGRELREGELAGFAPRNPDSCVRYGRTCEFFGVCTGEASLEDETKFRRSRTVHPELSEMNDTQQTKEESAS